MKPLYSLLWAVFPNSEKTPKEIRFRLAREESCREGGAKGDHWDRPFTALARSSSRFKKRFSLGFYAGLCTHIWEFPTIRGTLFWGPNNKDPTIWGTFYGSPIFGNSHMRRGTLYGWRRSAGLPFAASITHYFTSPTLRI